MLALSKDKYMEPRKESIGVSLESTDEDGLIGQN